MTGQWIVGILMALSMIGGFFLLFNGINIGGSIFTGAPIVGIAAYYLRRGKHPSNNED